MKKSNILHKAYARLVLSAALATVALVGYGNHSAHAGNCTPQGGGTYLCTGASNAALDTGQILNNGGALTITTANSFGIDTSLNGGNTLSLTSTNGLTFTDNYNSANTGQLSGISAINSGSSALSIISAGSVTGRIEVGIYARNGATGTDLAIASATVTSG